MESIKEYLVRLDLNPNRLPTVKEYKKAYREKLKNHPDKGGDTAVFQGITEAAMAVWQHMVENQNSQTRPETEKDSALLKNFESTNNVHYNKGNVVFDIDGNKAQLWIDCLQKRVGPPVPLADGSGVKMKTDHFKIPLVTCKTKHEYGSLSVTVYPQPKSSHPKIMIQGQAYLAFVTLVLPEVVKDMITPRLGLTTDTDTVASDCDSDAELHQDRIRQVSASTSTSLATNNMEDNVNMLHAFQRLENELVTIRTSLGTKVDAAIAHITKLSAAGLDSKIDNLENLLNSNLKETKELAQAVNDLSSSIKTNSASLDASQIDNIAHRVSNHPSLTQLSTTLSTMRAEVAKSTCLEGVMTEIQGISVSLNSLETQVNNVSKTLNETNEASNKDMAQIRKNSDNSLEMFLAMKTSLETLVQQAAHPNKIAPRINNDTSKPNNAEDNHETKTFKGIMFADSVAQEIDTKKLKEDINCDLKIIPTNYINHHPDSTDPDQYLQCMVNQHLAGKTNYDFAIIATGSNDITELDVKNSPPTTLTNAVADQTKTLVEIAKTLAAENKIDIFLIDKPPRYDPATNDPTSMYSKLAKYSNGVLASSVGMAPRLIIVDQSSLARSSIKARSDVYRPDGLNLTTKGLNYFTSNLTKALTECYTDMAITRPATRPTGYSTGADRGRGGNSDTSVGGNRQDRRYADRRDRQNFAYPVGQPYYAPYPDYPPPPPPHTGWMGGSGSWGGARPRQRNPRQGQYRERDYGSYAGYSGGNNRGFRHN